MCRVARSIQKLGVFGPPHHTHPALADLLDEAIVRKRLTSLAHGKPLTVETASSLRGVRLGQQADARDACYGQELSFVRGEPELSVPRLLSTLPAVPVVR